MNNFKNADDIFDFAIAREEISYGLYMDLSKDVEKPGMRLLLQDIAAEEKGHKERLLKIKKEGLFIISDKEIEDMRLSDYLKGVEEPDPDLSYQNALLMAINREKFSIYLYSYLSKITDISKLKEIFNMITHEEAKHKLSLESEYDKQILTEN